MELRLNDRITVRIANESLHRITIAGFRYPIYWSEEFAAEQSGNVYEIETGISVMKGLKFSEKETKKIYKAIKTIENLSKVGTLEY